jgi:acyl dehydratase
MSETAAESGWTGTARGRPAVGAIAERQRTTRAEDIVAFSEMSGDYNPLHYDEELARKTVFGRLIVQGGVTTALLNATVAEDLPGPGTVFLGVEWKFVKAVGIGERLSPRRNHERSRRQADLYPCHDHPRRAGRGLSHRHRDHVHCRHDRGPVTTFGCAGGLGRRAGYGVRGADRRQRRAHERTHYHPDQPRHRRCAGAVSSRTGAADGFQAGLLQAHHRELPDRPWLPAAAARQGRRELRLVR